MINSIKNLNADLASDIYIKMLQDERFNRFRIEKDTYYFKLSLFESRCIARASSMEFLKFLKTFLEDLTCVKFYNLDSSRCLTIVPIADNFCCLFAGNDYNEVLKNKYTIEDIHRELKVILSNN